tara:strand:- start:175 stop:522 length:348 start_codon:yes stop_codon:yes gene_type:complete
MNVPILQVLITKDAFSAVNKTLPAHELPIWLNTWGKAHIKIVGKTEKKHWIDSIEKEVERMEQAHGIRELQAVFGASYIDGIEISINRIIEKEKDVNDSKNTVKSENGTSAETRV